MGNICKFSWGISSFIALWHSIDRFQIRLSPKKNWFRWSRWFSSSSGLLNCFKKCLFVFNVAFFFVSRLGSIHTSHFTITKINLFSSPLFSVVLLHSVPSSLPYEIIWVPYYQDPLFLKWLLFKFHSNFLWILLAIFSLHADSYLLCAFTLSSEKQK